jgi:hypothetical protein
MTDASLIEEWQRASDREIKRHLTLTEDGLLLGADTVIAKRRIDGGMACEIDGREEEILALIAAAYGRPVSHDVIANLRRADQAFGRGDLVSAQMHIAFTGLHGIEDEEPASFRLFLADRLLQAGLSPRELLSELADETDLPETFQKAGPDDPKHPGWPAGTAGGLGGKFRPKDGTEAVISEELTQRIQRLATRRKARQMLSLLLRLGGEALLTVIPGIGEISDVAMVSELVAMIAELVTTANDSEFEFDVKAALEFANTRPHTLEELRAAATGPSQRGYENHHIVTQGGKNATNIPQELLQSGDNIVRVPTLLHEDINAAYSKNSTEVPGMTVYRWLQTQPFDVQYEEGVKIMRNLRLIQ